MAEEPPKKKAKRLCRWKAEWSSYNMSASHKGSSYAHCNVCSIDVSIVGGGLCDVKRHMEAKRHKDGAKAVTNQSTVTSLLRDKQQSLDKQVNYS